MGGLILKLIIEGLLLGGMLVVFCAVGIRKGPEQMVFLYHEDVQKRCVDMELIEEDQIAKNQTFFKSAGISFYFLFVLLCVYKINGARGFGPCFLQIFVILSIVNLVDRFFIDEYWVGHTGAWDIPGTEDLKPYITRHDKLMKWLMGTVGFAVLSAILAAVLNLVH